MLYANGLTPDDFFIEKIWPSQREVFNLLEIDQAAGMEIFRHFTKIDADGGGTVSVTEFHAYFKIQETPFTRRIFMALDADFSGELDYNEFVLGVWEICTFDRTGMAKFSFDIFDPDGNGSLTMDEVRAMLKLLFGDDAKRDLRRSERIIERADPNGDGVMDFKEWLLLVREFPELLGPALRAQDVVRNKVLGLEYWAVAMQFRMTTFRPLKTLAQILDDFDNEVESKVRPQMERAYGAGEELGKLAMDEAEEAARAAEERLLSALEPEEMEMRKLETKFTVVLQEAMEAVDDAEQRGFTGADLLESPEACVAIRAVERVLLAMLRQAPLASYASLERETRTFDADVQEEALRYYRNPDHSDEFGAEKKALLLEYREVVKFGGTGTSVISERAFRETSSLSDAAEYQVMLDRMAIIRQDKVERLKRKLEVSKDGTIGKINNRLHSLLSDFGIPDRHVDYTSTWQRRFDPARGRFYWLCPATGVCKASIPNAGDDDPDRAMLAELSRYSL
jgi:serine/threonine-protein phosphatase 2B regulatory subunit